MSKTTGWATDLKLDEFFAFIAALDREIVDAINLDAVAARVFRDAPLLADINRNMAGDT